jgi:hypothetical protein
VYDDVAAGASDDCSRSFKGLVRRAQHLPAYARLVHLGEERRAKFLSFASMLICTNDGFTGVDSIRLPKDVGDTVEVDSAGYDAGTELNTEDFADIVPPCQALVGVSSGEPGTGVSDAALAEGGVVHHHPGISGGADLVPAVHGWTDPVSEITVERVE